MTSLPEDDRTEGRDAAGRQPTAAISVKPVSNKWLSSFSVACAGAVLAALVLLWAASGFADIGIHGVILVALIGGGVLSTALGIGLMALIFASQRGNHDEAAYRYELVSDQASEDDGTVDLHD